MKVHHFLFNAICILLMAISCEKEPEVVKVESVTLNSTSLTMVEGESQTLTATVSPSNADNKKVIWSSSSSSVATVDDRGTVTAIAPGTATITAKSDDGGKTATCAVTVNSKVISVESVSLDKTTAEITEGETLTLTATVKPDNATNKKVTWSSSNEEIATVEDGVVTAKKAGEATITAKTEDGEKTASCSVTVKEKVYPVESVSLDKTEATLEVGETITLIATVSPDNATDKTVTWSSSDESIATVEDGVVTAIGVGSATITAKAGDKTATCAVTVIKKNIPVSGLSLNKESIFLTENRSDILQAIISPQDASNTTIIWESSNTSVAIVYEGQVQAVGLGTASISAKTEDGGYIAECEVNVIHLDNGAVDLGLSIKWASCNIGANSPEEYGYYFAWADTKGYVRNANNDGWVLASDNNVPHSFDKETYKASPAYSVVSDFGPDSGHDAARENWGDGWRMPSSREFNTLKDKCNIKYIDLNGRGGFLFTSKITGYTDKSIFIPLGGGCGSESRLADKTKTYFWTNHYVINDEPSYFKCDDRGMGCVYGSICNYMGINVRAVK